MEGVLAALITFLTTAIIMVRGKGFIKIIPFLIGIIVGYIASVALGLVDFAPVADAAGSKYQTLKYHLHHINQIL